MVASIAEKLTAMKAARDKVNHGTGRGLVVLKASIVDDEFGKLGLNLRATRSTGRTVSMTAYEAGGVAGSSLAINPAVGEYPEFRGVESPSPKTVSGERDFDARSTSAHAGVKEITPPARTRISLPVDASMLRRQRLAECLPRIVVRAHARTPPARSQTPSSCLT